MTDAELCLHAEALSGIGGWAFDGQTQGLHWTPQTFRLHGLDPGSPQPSLAQALALLADADCGLVDRALHTAIEQRKGLDLRFALRLPGGREQNLHCLAQFRPQPPGPGVLCGTLEYAVAAAGVGVWELDMVTGDEVWSDLTLAMYGLPSGAPAPTRQRWREEFLHPDDRERVALRGADFAAAGRAARTCFAVVDLTQLRQQDRRMAELLDRLKMATEASGVGIWDHNELSGEVHWDATTKQHFGLPADADTPGREAYMMLLHPADRARHGRVGRCPGAQHRHRISRAGGGWRRALAALTWPHRTR